MRVIKSHDRKFFERVRSSMPFYWTSLFITFLLVSTGLYSIATHAQVQKDEQVEFSRCWAFTEPDVRFSAIAADEKTVFASAPGAKMVAVAVATGAKLWATELGGEIVSNLLIVEAGLFVVTDSVPTGTAKKGLSTLRLLSSDTGITIKTVPLIPAESFTIGFDNGSVIIVSNSGDLYAFDSSASVLKWNSKTIGRVNGKTFIAQGSIVAGTPEGQVVRLGSQTGEISRTLKATTVPTTAMYTAAGQLVYGDVRGNVTAVDAHWRFRTGGQISGVYEIGNGYIVTSFDNFIYLLSKNTGSVVWKKRMAGRIADISFNSAVTALVFTSGAETAVLIELKKGKTLGQIALSEPTESVDLPDKSGKRLVFALNGSIFVFSSERCETENGTR